MYSEFRYNPEDFDYDLKENMIKVYDAVLRNEEKFDIYSLVDNLYFSIKDAIKFREIGEYEGRLMQRYFWEFA